jgi:hypothetical protein
VAWRFLRARLVKRPMLHRRYGYLSQRIAKPVLA